MTKNQIVDKIPFKLLVIFIALTAVILVVGIIYYKKQTAQTIEHIKNDLQTIAEYKASQIYNWRRERYGNAFVITASEVFTPSVRRWLKNPGDKALRSYINSRLEAFHIYDTYKEAFLVDPAGNVKEFIDKGTVEKISPLTMAIVKKAVQSRTILFTDFYYCDQCKEIHLDVVAPLFENDLVATVILRIDPNKFLYPLIQSWPLSNRTGETVLVHREGDEVVHLNELKHIKGTALKLRMSIKDTLLPAVKAVLGYEGIIEGRDYQGNKTLAFVNHIANSPWFMIVKMDQDEIYTPLYRQKRNIAIIFFLLLAAAGLTIGFFWQADRRGYYKKQYSMELGKLALAQHYDYLTKYANDIIFLLDEKQKVVEVNERALQAYGYTNDEMLGLDTAKIRAPEVEERFREQMKDLFSKGSLLYETVHRCKDGTTFPVEISARTIEIKGKKYLQGIGRDISERKKSQEALKQSEERFRALVETQRDLITRWLPDTTLTYVNQAYCDFIGKKPEEMLGISWLLLLPAEDREKFQKFYRELALHPEINEYEHQAKAADGLEHWVAWSEVPIFDKSGNLIEFQSVGRDITERKNSESLQQALYKISDAAIGCHDLKQLYIQIHQTIANLMPSENFYVAIYDRKSDTISFPYYKDQKNDYHNPRRFGKGLTEYIITTNKPLLVNKQVHDQLQKEGQAEFVGQPSKQWLGVPLQSENKTFGALVVQSYDEKSEYTQKDLELLNFVAGVVATAILSIKSAQALEESESQKRLILQSLPVAVYTSIKDPNIDAVSINGNVTGITGFTADEFLSRPDFWRKRLHPDDRKRVLAVFQTADVTGQNIVEYRWQHKDGNYRWLHDRFIVKETAGQPEFLGVLSDTTERKQAEDALKESEERYRALFQKAGDAIIIMEAEGPDAGKIVAANQAAAAMHGYDMEEISSLHISDLDAPSEHGEMAQRIERILKGEWIACETLHRRNDGTEFPMECKAGLLEYGGRKYILAFDRDITGRKLMEQELLQAQKMEAVGFLAGGVAHDFNNMLAGIVGNAELLQLKVYGQKELETYVDNIIKASGHAATLTKQLLAFARKGQYQQAPVNIHKIIAETLGILSNTIDRRIKIEQHLKANPALVLGDHSQLENALMNLGINARDAMPQGGKLIFSTELANLDEEYISHHKYKIQPGHYIQITVEDSGSGMSDEVKRHLFEPFFTTKEKGKGTGLGLAGVYGCVKNHGGSIEVYSEPGRGTAIKLYLPLYGDLADEDQGFNQPQYLSTVAGTGSILIVDDEEMIRSIAAQILKTAGYQVQTCADGREAVDRYVKEHDKIDLVIMDMVMPRVDGREAFTLMRRINPRVKVLLSSGFSEDSDAQSILQDGALGFIQKPYRSAELLLKVQQALQATPNQSLRGTHPA